MCEKCGSLGDAVEQLTKAFGSPMKALEVIKAIHTVMDFRSEPIRSSIEGLHYQIDNLVQSLDLPRFCSDSKGNPLEVGDEFKTPGGRKRVLRVGLVAVLLTHTEDESEADGWWTEDQIKIKGWVKNVEFTEAEG